MCVAGLWAVGSIGAFNRSKPACPHCTLYFAPSVHLLSVAFHSAAPLSVSCLGRVAVSSGLVPMLCVLVTDILRVALHLSVLRSCVFWGANTHFWNIEQITMIALVCSSDILLNCYSTPPQKEFAAASAMASRPLLLHTVPTQPTPFHSTLSYRIPTTTHMLARPPFKLCVEG